MKYLHEDDIEQLVSHKVKPSAILGLCQSALICIAKLTWGYNYHTINGFL